jgi:hypothetical protein
MKPPVFQNDMSSLGMPVALKFEQGHIVKVRDNVPSQMGCDFDYAFHIFD